MSETSETISETTESEYDVEYTSRGLNKRDLYPDMYDLMREEMENDVRAFYDNILEEVNDSKENAHDKGLFVRELEIEKKQIYYGIRGYTECI